MEINVIESSGDYSHLVISGRMDLEGVQKGEMLFTVNTSSQKRHAVIDLSEVTYIVSHGIRLLLTTARTLHRGGHKLILLSPSPEVLQVLELSGITGTLPVVQSIQDAEAMM